MLAAASAGKLALAEAGIGPGAADGLTPLTPEFLAPRLAAAAPLPRTPRMTARRSLRSARSGSAASAGRILAVASGKGGVGKTWFAITLAHALSRRGRRVLLFDGDLGLANVDIQLGLTPDADLAAVASGRIPLAEAVQSAMTPAASTCSPGARAPVRFRRLSPVALESMLAALRAASVRYDVVILDLGAGLDRAVRRMASWADGLLVLATEEPTSLTDAYAVLKLHAADRGRAPRIIVNQATSTASGERTYATLSRACAQFLGQTPPLAGIIRRDDKVREALRRQALLLTRHPGSHAAADVEAVAAALL